MRYSKEVLDRYKNPVYAGSFEDSADDDIGTGLSGAAACGDVLQVQIKVKDGVIEDAKFMTFGCPSAIASSSVAIEWIKNKKLSEAVEITNKDIADYLSLPPIKLHCSVLAEEAIKNAIKNYEDKVA